METLDAIKRAEEYGYLTHEEAMTLAKKAFGVEAPPAPEPTTEVPGETPAA